MLVTSDVDGNGMLVKIRYVGEKIDMSINNGHQHHSPNLGLRRSLNVGESLLATKLVNIENRHSVLST